MTFGEALEKAKKGYRITRKNWNGKGQYVGIADNFSFLFEGQIVNANHQTCGNRALVFFGTSGTQVGWLASQADMLSDDWEVF